MLTTALVAAGLAILVLFTPLDLRVHLVRRPELTYRVGVAWLYGLVSRDFDDRSFRGRVRPAAPAKPAGPRKPPKRGRRRNLLAMLRSEGFLPGVGRLGRRLARAVRIRRAHLWLRAGFEDPADTGLMSAWLYPLAAYGSNRFPGRLDLAPDFERERLAFALDGELRVRPASLLWPVLAFGVSPSTLRGLIALR